MQKKTVFILQDTKERCDCISSMFVGDNDFSIMGCSCDGREGLKRVLGTKPDFLICELVLCGYDGMNVLKEIKKSNIATKVIVLSSLARDEVIGEAIENGAKYFFAKPVNFDLLKERMLELEREEVDAKKENLPMRKQETTRTILDEKISKIFINVGIPPHIKGYSFLREGVKMAVDDPQIINSITKKLYPKIGEKYQTSASKVERAIRHAIEVAWNRGRIESINGILGVRAYVGSEKPTNGEFIAIIADHMLLENV